MKHTAITSLAPGHKNFDNQLKAVLSWMKHGFNVVSINHPNEINGLKEQFPEVEFVPTIRTNEKLFKKPYPTISAIIDHLKIRSEEKFLLINSDIVIYDSWKIQDDLCSKADNGVVVMARYNYEDEYKFGRRYAGGFDAFWIHKKFLHIFPQTVLCVGQCFWDYWFPYQCVLNKVKMYEVPQAYIFHKNHETQWSEANYKATANIFRAELSVIDPAVKTSMTDGQASTYVYYRIIENLN